MTKVSATKSKSRGKSTSRAKTARFDPAAVFAALRAVLEPYRGSFDVTDEPGHFSLVDNSLEGWSLDFAAVVAKPRAVSFYVYFDGVTPDVSKRASTRLLALRTKTGGFFNFQEPDAELIAELGTLVKAVFEGWDASAITARL